MHLTLIERYIIEAIGTNEVTLDELFKRTSLDLRVLIKVVERLQELDYLISKNKEIRVNTQALSNYRTNKELEIRRLFSELSIHHNELKIKKVNLSQTQAQRLKVMFEEIERFLNSCKTRPEKINEQNIFFWGNQNYNKLITEYLY
jgi:hypothetical protein